MAYAVRTVGQHKVLFVRCDRLYFQCHSVANLPALKWSVIKHSIGGQELSIRVNFPALKYLEGLSNNVYLRVALQHRDMIID
ncbi:hypothetical protein [Vibrio sp. T11.5]|uniref:hypothetical protein n=1 Tax=Vibrio sp. T11.5 TaxID=2998836 RepID=UPI0022CD5ECB|nr:hypothetical protein [Vibrio sp. T11.5]MDA0116569.1 hypothetical protein [Vibrio sp. T11.5]